MPQMAPMSWVILFILFSLTFILFNLVNYYLFNYKSINSTNTKKYPKSNFNWKW
uniref:ATP synthase complex subunit 8 n=1 Tax=Ptilodactylidae sp. 3 ACP-2013 TaxID=1434564 RepID=A0A3G3FX21_9COLE|nr:ATP synthase F0 subunit 8 [Ptilodactylidae sp. 3 ACP-2013]